jgi:hypothetical protein
MEDLDKGNEESIDPGQQAEVSADCAAAPTTDQIAEVSSRKKEERDPEQKKNAPRAFAQVEGHDPQQKGKHAPHQQSEGHSRGGWSLQPAGADRPLHEGEAPPEEAIRGEGNHAEGVAGLELQYACDELGDSAVSEGQGNDGGDSGWRQDAGVNAATDNCGQAKSRQSKGPGLAALNAGGNAISFSIVLVRSCPSNSLRTYLTYRHA